VRTVVCDGAADGIDVGVGMNVGVGTSVVGDGVCRSWGGVQKSKLGWSSWRGKVGLVKLGWSSWGGQVGMS
jgi:hypothetical protein